MKDSNKINKWNLLCILKALHAKAVNSSEIPEEFCIENRFWARNSGSRYLPAQTGNFSFEKSLELTNFSQNAQQVKWIFLIGFLCFQMTWSQTVFGKWKTVDDRNGIAKAIIHIYKEDGLMHAKVVKILEEGKEDALCTKCDGELKDKPVLGMKIMDDFEANGKGEYKGDRLFDPEQGMTFRGKVWLDEENENRLKVRGYLAFLHRTQTWHRVIEQ